MQINTSCFSCILTKQEKRTEQERDEEKKKAYFHEVLGLLYQYGMKEASPWIAVKIDELYEAYYGVRDEGYRQLKQKYNRWMLSREKELEDRIRAAKEPVHACIRYVCAGNYIDFAAVTDVNESMLKELLDKAEAETVPEEEYRTFLKDLEEAETLVYLTDNCGEIVLDKIFIRILKEVYPHLKVTVIVRGQEVVNDATMEDAKETGLTEVADCMGNGCAMAGTVLDKISKEAREKILSADVIISKGQGNFEGLYGSGVNPYYLFLCKCRLFTKRFGLPQFSSVFAREDHIKMKV